MARPKKTTVDYFPHTCSHKTTVFILEQKYGNDGYAFWFKILEMLASTEGHYIDCNNIHKWEFLQAKTYLDENKCNEILDLLAKLDAIDKKLWSKRIVWSNNFIDGIADVYKNRRVDIPIKPSFYRRKPQQKGVSTDINPHSKLKETKLKETKVNIFLDYFNFKTGKKLTLTDVRQRIIEQRLKTHTLDQLKIAVDNFILDTWEDRHKFTDVVYCIGVRKGIDNLEKWLNYSSDKKPEHITVSTAISLIQRNQTTSTMEEILNRLPEKDLPEFMTIVNKDNYIKGIYQRAKKEKK